MDDKLRFVPTFVHGIIDYVTSVLLFAAPFYFGWTGAQKWIAIVVALIFFVQTVFTDFELGIVRFLRIRFHLFMEFVLGIFLIAAPFIWNFPRANVWPYFMVGALAIFLFITTKKQALGTAV